MKVRWGRISVLQDGGRKTCMSVFDPLPEHYIWPRALSSRDMENGVSMCPGQAFEQRNEDYGSKHNKAKAIMPWHQAAM